MKNLNVCTAHFRQTGSEQRPKVIMLKIGIAEQGKILSKKC